MSVQAHADGAGVRAAALLDIEGAAKTYRLADGSMAPALLPVSTQLYQGEFTSLLGPSGCGKTTLLKMAAGLVQPSAGRICRSDTGRPVHPGSYGFVFQAPALLPWRTVLENVLLPADILGLERGPARRRAHQLLDTVHLGHAIGKRPQELSGGMQQRAAIARALLSDPDLLFMDEPFGALDAMTREELNLELQRLHLEQRKTVVFVTHDIEEAVLLSDRILVMSAGPGRLITDIEVDMPRPRQLADKQDPRFYTVVARVRSMLQRHASAGAPAAV